jgi:hypothetical protein
MQPPAKRSRFDLQARVAATQSTQRKFGELRAASLESVPGRVTKSRLVHAQRNIATCLRDMRAIAGEYHADGVAAEIEVRLGRFISKQTGTRFDYGKGLCALPSSAGTITDIAFEAGVDKEHYDLVYSVLERERTMGRLSCHSSDEEVYIFDTAQKGTSNRLFVDASQTPLAMQRKETLRDFDGCIFMPPPLSKCDARIGLSIETSLPASDIPRSVPAGWQRRRRRQRHSYTAIAHDSAAGDDGAQAAYGWRADITTVLSWESSGKQTQSFEVELEMGPEAVERYIASGGGNSEENRHGDEAWVDELAESLWWGMPHGVGRLSGLTVDNSMPMALLPSEPASVPLSDRLLRRCRSLLDGQQDPEHPAPGWPGSVALALCRRHVPAVQGGLNSGQYWLSARPAGQRYLLLLQSCGGGVTAAEAGAWLVSTDGKAFAILGEVGTELVARFGRSHGKYCPLCHIDRHAPTTWCTEYFWRPWCRKRRQLQWSNSTGWSAH